MNPTKNWGWTQMLQYQDTTIWLDTKQSTIKTYFSHSIIKKHVNQIMFMTTWSGSYFCNLLLPHSQWQCTRVWLIFYKIFQCASEFDWLLIFFNLYVCSSVWLPFWRSTVKPTNFLNTQWNLPKPNPEYTYWLILYKLNFTFCPNDVKLIFVN
jgi:hypothetical protein